jgi:two-component system, response regulator
MPTDILLIEDNACDEQLFFLALKQYRLTPTIHVARDGQEALNFLYGNRKSDKAIRLPRLILLDLKIPRITGFEVLARIRAEPSTSKCTVVVLSSSALPRDVDKAYQLGANSYLVKEVSFPRFADSIYQLVSYWLKHNRLPSKARGNHVFEISRRSSRTNLLKKVRRGLPDEIDSHGSPATRGDS